MHSTEVKSSSYSPHKYNFDFSFLFHLLERRACRQGAVRSLCMVRPGSGRFGVGFWVGFWVGLCARAFPTERVLSRTPLIIRTVDQKSEKNFSKRRRRQAAYGSIDITSSLDICEGGLIPRRHKEGHIRQLSNWDA